MDLEKKVYSREKYEQYILGSAEVVGLMCLCVFTNGDKELYNHLLPYAMKLGAAFQKVNFLRDINADYINLGRSYFPDIDLSNFSTSAKKAIEKEIDLTSVKSLEVNFEMEEDKIMGIMINPPFIRSSATLLTELVSFKCG